MLNHKSFLRLGTVFLILGIFISTVHVLLQSYLDPLDRALLGAFTGLRPRWLTAAASDITALGSFGVGAIVSLVAIVVFWTVRYRKEGLQILVSFAGATLWLHLIKNIIQRPRPGEASRLVFSAGYSYPSGHALTASSLYLALAIVCAGLLTTRRSRSAVTALAIVIVLLVGISRIYLGVHYPSDVAGGLSLGAAWALLVAAAFHRGKRHTNSHSEQIE